MAFHATSVAVFLVVGHVAMIFAMTDPTVVLRGAYGEFTRKPGESVPVTRLNAPEHCRSAGISDHEGSIVPTLSSCWSVVIQDSGAGRTEVAAIDPVASMQAIDNPRLRQAAQHVQDKLRKVIDSL